jgi:uncharacterized protein
MIKRFFLVTILFFFSNFSFANSDIKIPELVGRAMFEGSVQPTESQKENLTAALRNLEAENKVQMGVLVVDSVKPYSIEEYSIMVAEKWKIGQKGVDNGVLMVVATKDRKARIEVGNGLQGSLTDAMSKRIQVEKMVPEFKKGQFIDGIIATVNGIKEVTVKETPVITQALEVKKAKEASNEMSPGAVFLLIFGSIAGFVGIITYFVVKNTKNKEAARKRREADLAEYSRRQNQYSESVSKYRNSSGGGYSRGRSSSSSRSTSSASSSIKQTSGTSKSTSTNSGYTGYSSNSDDINKNKSNDSSYSPSISNNSDTGISGGGSFNGGGSTTDW